jgi:hypothetical protein
LQDQHDSGIDRQFTGYRYEIEALVDRFGVVADEPTLRAEFVPLLMMKRRGVQSSRYLEDFTSTSRAFLLHAARTGNKRRHLSIS